MLSSVVYPFAQIKHLVGSAGSNCVQFSGSELAEFDGFIGVCVGTFELVEAGMFYFDREVAWLFVFVVMNLDGRQ